MQIYKGFGLDMPYGVVSAKVNNHVEGLNFRVYHNKDVEFLDISSESGLRTYVRSLCFVLCKAVADVFPDGQILLEHPVSRGYYCSLRIGREPELADVTRIKQRMAEIIAADLPFHRIEQHSEEAIRLFEQKGMTDKVKLLRTTGRLYTYYYTLDGFVDYYYGSLLPSTGHLHLFDLVKYYDGLLLRFPDRMNPSVLGEMVKQEKMFDVFNENRRWQEIMGVSTVGDFNEAIAEGHATDLINVAEALQEKRIARIADDICARPDVKVVLISGPSSSGKTTFSKRLSVQLMANGKRPHPISLDDYFVDREKTPRDADGNYDYEALEAIDLELFNDHLARLIRGESVDIPRYDFITGRRTWHNAPLTLDERSILIIEGIHGLNPRLTPSIPDAQKFRIYISCFTSVAMDNLSRIATTDNRLLRRLTRDYRQRGADALSTLSRWASVRRGEEKHIFPYQENADIMLNSSLFYEISVLRPFAEKILREVPDTVPEYDEARRMLKFLDNFIPISPEEIPPTSLLREFIGGSSFKY